MTKIDVSCVSNPKTTLRIKPEDISVIAYFNEEGERQALEYSFFCTCCGVIENKPTDHIVAGLLTANGSEYKIIDSVKREPLPADEISVDDQIEFLRPGENGEPAGFKELDAFLKDPLKYKTPNRPTVTSREASTDLIQREIKPRSL